MSGNPSLGWSGPTWEPSFGRGALGACGAPGLKSSAQRPCACPPPRPGSPCAGRGRPPAVAGALPLARGARAAAAVRGPRGARARGAAVTPGGLRGAPPAGAAEDGRPAAGQPRAGPREGRGQRGGHRGQVCPSGQNGVSAPFMWAGQVRTAFGRNLKRSPLFTDSGGNGQESLRSALRTWAVLSVTKRHEVNRGRGRCGPRISGAQPRAREPLDSPRGPGSGRLPVTADESPRTAQLSGKLFSALEARVRTEGPGPSRPAGWGAPRVPFWPPADCRPWHAAVSLQSLLLSCVPASAHVLS